jgi:hypothetical protein
LIDRGDPVRVARHISAIVNSVDDNGIMVGNWKDDFRGGTAPTDWHGSLAILQQFYKTKKPVKFGQCWVFSGLTTTRKTFFFLIIKLNPIYLTNL